MLLLPLVFVRQNFFEPVGLLGGAGFGSNIRVVKYYELLAASITPQGSHFLKTGRLLSGLPFLDRNRFHALILP